MCFTSETWRHALSWSWSWNDSPRDQVQTVCLVETVHRLNRNSGLKPNQNFQRESDRCSHAKDSPRFQQASVLGYDYPLDLSKTLMYDFHHNFTKKKYGERVRLLFTDTDSLMYEIKTKDLCSGISNHFDLKFNTSNHPKDHPIYSAKNRKVIGMIEDEAGRGQITELVGLREKLHSYLIDENKKCKGITKNVIKKGLRHEDFRKLPRQENFNFERWTASTRKGRKFSLRS